MNRDEVIRDLNIVWDKLDSVLEKLWNEVSNQNRNYKIQSLTRKRKRLIREETKLIRNYINVIKESRRSAMLLLQTYKCSYIN